MYKMMIKDLDLDQVYASGQAFRWSRCMEKVYDIPAFGHMVRIVQNGDEFAFSCGEEEYREIWESYLDVSADYGRIKRLADEEDLYLAEAIRFGSGIRILKQELWEIMVSFVISQNNNIPRIRKSIEALCARFGDENEWEHGNFYVFPDAGRLAEASIEEYAGLGLGYRDKYIKALAEAVNSGEFKPELLLVSDYETAHAMLMKQYGIGKKVADCICLFGLHHVDAFPIDTHIRQILDAHYPDGFPLARYRGYNGILQQYLFYYDLFGASSGRKRGQKSA